VVIVVINVFFSQALAQYQGESAGVSVKNNNFLKLFSVHQNLKDFAFLISNNPITVTAKVFQPRFEYFF
jgi:hypothetical protein